MPKYRVFLDNGTEVFLPSPSKAWRYEGLTGQLVVPTSLSDPLALVLDELTGQIVEQRSLLASNDLEIEIPLPVQSTLVSTMEGVSLSWGKSLLASAVGYVVELNERDSDNEYLWTRQHGKVLPLSTTSWTYKMLEENQQAWFRVSVVDSSGQVLSTLLKDSVVQVPYAIRGPISLWTSDLTLGTNWKQNGSGTVTVSGIPGNQTLAFSAASTSIQQIIPTYPQSGRDYDLVATVVIDAADVNKTLQFYCHDTTSGGQTFSQDYTFTSSGEQTIRINRGASTSNGRFFRFGMGTYNSTTLRSLKVKYFAVGVKGFTPNIGEKRVWQEPLLIDGSNTSSTSETVFSGFYESTVRTQNCVQINTTNEVVCRDFYTLATGEHFQTLTTNVRLKLQRGMSRGKNPGVNKLAAGLFIRSGGIKRLLVEDWSFGQSGGIRLADSNVSTDDYITLRRLHVKNIDGRRSNGGTGKTDYIKSAINAYAESGSTGADSSGRIVGRSLYQFLNLNNDNKSDASMPNVSVTDCFIENWPDESASEDNINFLKAGGTASSPITIDRMCVWGGYPWDFQRGLATPSDQYNFGAITNIDTSGSGSVPSMTGCLLQDSLTTSSWKKVGHNTRLRNSFFLGPGTITSIQAGTNHIIEDCEMVASKKCRDGVTKISGDQRVGIEVSFNTSFVQTDSNGTKLRNSYNQYIPKTAPDPTDSNIQKPLSENVGARNNKLTASGLYYQSGAWSFYQGFTTFDCRPDFRDPNSLTSGNTVTLRDATTDEEHEAFLRWMIKVEDAGSSWGLR